MKVFIDPGHGGNDPGAIGIKGTRESDVVLMVGKELKAILEKAGFEVLMSRTADVNISLANRAEMANRAGADIFVSLHCNGFTSGSANGTETYSYMGDEEGARLSELVLEEICRALATVNRGAKKENFAVLRLTEMPSILIETAFITNPREEAMMLEADFPEKVSKAIADGIFAYFNYTAPIETGKHWGQEYLERLIEKGYIKNPELWENFDSPPTNAMILALFDKITEENIK